MFMKMKSLVMLACALVIVSSMVFGSIAYLTDRTGVVNRFTVGNVDIVVDETLVGANGEPVYPDGFTAESGVLPKRTETANEYPLIPGAEYIKDPTLTVKAGSEEAYVRMVVTISSMKEIKEIFAELAVQYPAKYAAGFVPQNHVSGADATAWTFVGMTENDVSNTFTLEYRYPVAVKPAADADTVLPSLFKTIKVPGELTNAQLSKLSNFTIEVYGNAIQTTGFVTADDAWAAFDAQLIATGAVVTP